MISDPVQNAAVTLVAPIMLAFNAVNNLFGVGTSSMMSRSLGAKDYDAVRKSSAFGFYCALFCGLMISLFCTLFQNPILTFLGANEVTMEATRAYMRWTVCAGAAPAILNVVMAYLVRSEGAAMHASIGTMSGCILNIILDPFFILPSGLNMGAAGAGMATCISNCVACLYFFILLFLKRNKTFVCVNPRKFSWNPRIIREICFVGIPASIQNLLNVTGMTLLNISTAVYGAEAVAAMGISQKSNNVAWMICLGAAQGIMPMVSYNYTSGNRKRMKDTILFFASFMVPLSVLIMVSYYIWARQIIGFFLDTETVVEYGTRFIRGFCLAMPFLCVDFLAVNVFQALGLGQYSLLFAILRKIVLEIPGLIILNHLYPLYGMVYAQPIAEVILGIAAVIMLLRILRSGKNA
jgi:putative MATE family efflux protein